MARTKSRNLALFGVGAGLLALVALAGVAAVLALGGRLTGSVTQSAIDEHCEANAGGRSGTLDVDQAENAALIATVARQRNLPPRAVTIALATAMQESGIRNLDYGDRDSLGMFQQRPSQGWGTAEQVQDPRYAAGKFYDQLVQVPDYLTLPITVAAQEVQRSAYPDAYAQHEAMARAFASALSGESPAAVTCVLRPAAPGATPQPVTKAIAAAFPAARATVAAGPYGEPVVTVKAGDEKDAWALAHWAVVAAKRFDITDVEVGDKLWNRAAGTWQDSTRQHPPAGTVVLTLSRPTAAPTSTPAP